MVKYYGDDPDPPFIKALAEVRHLATREGCVTSTSKRCEIVRQPPNTSSRIGEAVSCAASHETCADIPGLPRNKRILHDTTF